ncbi:MAG: hypothetical protein ACOYL9_14370 [Ilumatobacteraceae bacterium]
MADEQRVKVFVHPIVLTEHVFDKVRSIDMTLAEFNADTVRWTQDFRRRRS